MADVLCIRRGRRWLHGWAADMAVQSRMRKRGLIPDYPVVIPRPTEPEPA